jgi:UDP-N-acetylglucosamine 2-epimerase (non-hydrolysing)
MKKVLVCVGTRPNLIKITRLKECFAKYPHLQFKLLHTGQHYDYKMSEVFFEELGIPKPDVLFELKRDSQISVVTQIMALFEAEIKKDRPDLVVVPGDVDSTFACAFVSSRYGIPVAHIESGLRSWDKTMPEEINRILVDDIAQLFFTTEKSGNANLLNEGKRKESIVFTGNTMIDSLIKFKPNIDKSEVLSKYSLEKGKFLVMTFHRPANVDNKDNLSRILNVLNTISKGIKIIFPIHPRTIKNAEAFGLKHLIESSQIILCEPQGYLDFMKLISSAVGVVTDSGGIQEETTFLGVPCLTVRNNTERPITAEVGTNTLLELNEHLIIQHVNSILSGTYKKGQVPELWDGKSSERIVEAIAQFLN